jgi:hypothetical protein
MPILENQRHERFAQGLAKGLCADKAYVEAGFRANRGNAIRLKANERVVKRVEELQGRAVEGVQISKQWVMEQLVDNVVKAKEAKEFAPANKALELLGKEVGMFKDRVEHTGKGGGPIQTVDLTNFSNDDLDRLEDILVRAANPGGGKGGEGETEG